MKKLLHLFLAILLVSPLAAQTNRPGSMLGIAQDPNGAIRFLNVNSLGKLITIAASGPGFANNRPGANAGVAIDPDGNRRFLSVDATGALIVDAEGGTSYDGSIETNAQTGTTYELVEDDAGKLVTLTNASAITITVPANADVAFDVGTRVWLKQGSTGLVTVAAGSGVTVTQLSSTLAIGAAGHYASLLKTATNTWELRVDMLDNATAGNPGTGDDTADGYQPGSIWRNTSTGSLYYCTSNSAGAAAWKLITADDTAYDATSWNGNLDAPSKNAVRDKIESLSTGGGKTLMQFWGPGGNGYSPGDGATLYFGALHGTGFITTSTGSEVYSTVAGTITDVSVYWAATSAVGDNAQIDAHILVNGSATAIASQANTSNPKRFTATGLSIAVAVGDLVQIRLTCPTWPTTNPTGVVLSGIATISL